MKTGDGTFIKVSYLTAAEDVPYSGSGLLRVSSCDIFLD